MPAIRGKQRTKLQRKTNEVAAELLREYGYDDRLQPKACSLIFNFSDSLGRYFRDLSRAHPRAGPSSLP